MMPLGLRLTPQGRLICEPVANSPGMDEAIAARLQQAFAHSSGEGLLRLGAGEVGQALPPVFVWWRDFAARYVSALCVQAAGAEDGAAPLEVRPPDEAELGFLVLTAPLMPGAEYLTADILRDLWSALAAALAADLAASGARLQDALKRLNPAWNLVGRVHFNLAENRRDPDAPFAFLATYASRLSAQARCSTCRSAKRCANMAVPLIVPSCSPCCCRFSAPPRPATGCACWSIAARSSTRCAGAREAWRLLASAADLERAGVVLRMPAGWTAGRPPRPQVTATVGGRAPSKLGLDGLLDFRVATTLDGEELSAAEIRLLLAGTDNLVLLRGRWVEVDRAKLQHTLDRFRAAETLAARDGLPFAEAMRLLAGSALGKDAADAVAADWSQVTAGPWLAETLRALRCPRPASSIPARRCTAVCGPTRRLGCGGCTCSRASGSARCLADDMGLGKTIQVLALLLVLQREATGNAGPSPAGRAGLAARQLGGGDRALRPGAAGLHRASVGHASRGGEALHRRAEAAGLDLVITSYGSLLRLPVLEETHLAAGHPRRGAGDQEPRRQADPRGQGAEGARRASR